MNDTKHGPFFFGSESAQQIILTGDTVSLGDVQYSYHNVRNFFFSDVTEIVNAVPITRTFTLRIDLKDGRSFSRTEGLDVRPGKARKVFRVNRQNNFLHTLTLLRNKTRLKGICISPRVVDNFWMAWFHMHKQKTVDFAWLSIYLAIALPLFILLNKSDSPLILIGGSNFDGLILIPVFGLLYLLMKKLSHFLSDRENDSVPEQK